MSCCVDRGAIVSTSSTKVDDNLVTNRACVDDCSGDFGDVNATHVEDDNNVAKTVLEQRNFMVKCTDLLDVI